MGLKRAMSPTDELKSLARTLADWAAAVPTSTIYLYGSRVRGDHRPNSDVDISIVFAGTDEEVTWWGHNNLTGFAAINEKLPGPLQILECSDPLADEIRNAEKVYRDRNIVCVWRGPKP